MPKYEKGIEASEVPEKLCKRAAWYLNSIGLDWIKYDRLTKKEFQAAYSATQMLNIPVHCDQDKRTKAIKCFCYPPVWREKPASGMFQGKKRKKKRGGKRK